MAPAPDLDPEAELRRVLSEELSYSAQIDSGTALGSGGLDLDSLSRMEIVAAIEERFGVVLTDEDIDRMAQQTFGELVDLVDARRAPGS